MAVAIEETMAVGTRLVEMCREGRNLEAIAELYGEGIESCEVMAPDGMDTVTRGRDGVLAKNEWWLANHEVHEKTIDGPYPHGDRFAVVMAYDITPGCGPMEGQRFTMREVGLYTVSGGKIVKEEFFYNCTG